MAVCTCNYLSDDHLASASRLERKRTEKRIPWICGLLRSAGERLAKVRVDGTIHRGWLGTRKRDYLLFTLDHVLPNTPGPLPFRSVQNERETAKSTQEIKPRQENPSPFQGPRRFALSLCTVRV